MADKETMRAFGTLGSVGLSFVISIVLGAGLGLLVDRWIGAGHWEIGRASCRERV